MSKRSVHEKRSVEVEVTRDAEFCDCCQAEVPLQVQIHRNTLTGSDYRHVSFISDTTGWCSLVSNLGGGEDEASYLFCPSCGLKLVQDFVAGQLGAGAGSL